MRSITIGLSYPNHFKIGACAISLYTHRLYSHALVYWDSPSIQETLVYQASLGMVHFCSMENFKQNNDIIKEFKLNLTDNQFTKLVKKCVQLAGIEYSKLELLNIFLDQTLKKDILGDQPGFICSELVADLLEEIFNKPFPKPKYLVTPADIDDYLTDNI